MNKKKEEEEAEKRKRVEDLWGAISTSVDFWAVAKRDHPTDDSDKGTDGDSDGDGDSDNGDDEKLRFKKGDLIHVIEEDEDDGTYFGQLEFFSREDFLNAKKGKGNGTGNGDGDDDDEDGGGDGNGDDGVWRMEGWFDKGFVKKLNEKKAGQLKDEKRKEAFERQKSRNGRSPSVGLRDSANNAHLNKPDQKGKAASVGGAIGGGGGKEEKTAAWEGAKPS